MTTLTRPSMNTKGFTLIELLVVIAIISILATIAVPNIIKFLTKGNNAKAISEINNADTVLISMLTDARKQNFLDFLNDGSRSAVLEELEFINDTLNPDFTRAAALQGAFDIMFYELLRRGKEADLSDIGWDLDPQVRSKLGTSYFEELGNDPWNERYHFWIGPIRRRWPVLIRSYRTDGVNSFNYSSPVPYMFDQAQRNFEQDLLPGQPNVDNYAGYPAPRDKPVYMWSAGANLVTDSLLAISAASGFYQDPEFAGGGDDINNWDSAGGWEDAPDI